ncbi:MAG: acyltransferase, partial [Rhodococcus sp. (in: high G+C Gram-positive bacteria)]|nr:acyltransferase [Rhodococcus sp. (in: high G+C Gram-positive bacteria)]
AWEAGAADRAKYIAALEDIARKKALGQAEAAREI